MPGVDEARVGHAEAPGLRLGVAEPGRRERRVGAEVDGRRCRAARPVTMRAVGLQIAPRPRLEGRLGIARVGEARETRRARREAAAEEADVLEGAQLVVADPAVVVGAVQLRGLRTRARRRSRRCGIERSRRDPESSGCA